ncbi:hypothetical protein E2C01_090558 [Portunus trituberculatus]|uniref:Uncharacterized protein n=1 Tax=Portunus trituberculatus TaxID=210409 RepID=A0A5B7JBP9_PORTR|nr:hypothetical protein [Portunus trituberculatus]
MYLQAILGEAMTVPSVHATFARVATTPAK